MKKKKKEKKMYFWELVMPESNKKEGWENTLINFLYI